MSESHQREAAIFDAAMEMSPEQRASHLDLACGGDAALRQRMESLLKACENSSGYLDSPTDPMSVEPTNALPPSFEKAGDRIGRYKLLQQIGEGGCGVVYMAEQEEPVSRRVALKVIKLGLDTKSVIARFEAERQALALMDHPNIAKVLDAGATETGRPYFVMELVRGLKITEYCDEARLSTHARLDLFIQVCQAIQHAHQKGIIHRDIKPSNILVTINDGVPVPKVIDFGIAKATGGLKLTDKTIFTAFEQFIGTPAYMSPEQATLASLDIDTRSDIYALGVLLYELLTGKTPFDAKELLAIGLDEMRRTIRDQEPPRPSTRLSTLPGEELSTTAQRRGIEAPKLVSELRGDLDWIVMKCIEKDRARRYETANSLAADVQHHLNDEPVAARPPSRLYRLQKTVRRNKLAFAAAAVVAGALLAGLSIATWMFVRERAAVREQSRLRHEAQKEAAKSKEIADLLKSTFEGVGPSVALGRDTLLLREILEKTVQRVGRDLTNQPEVEAELRDTIGRVYEDLDLRESAERELRRAWSLRRSVLGETHPLTLESKHRLANRLEFNSKWAEAEVLIRELLAVYKAQFGRDDPRVINALHVLGNILKKKGSVQESVILLREVVRLKRQLYNHDPRELCLAVWALAAALHAGDELDEAIAQYKQALELCASSQLQSTPKEASLWEFLGQAQIDRNRLGEAEESLRKAFGVLERCNMPVRTPKIRLAVLRTRQEKFSEAETLLQESWAVIANNVDQNMAITRNVFRAFKELYDAWSKIESSKIVLAAEWNQRLTEFVEAHVELKANQRP